MAKDAFAHIEDSELLNRFYSDKNNYWLGILLKRYTMLLLGVSMKYLKDEEKAKDAVQYIFIKVITELEKYKVEYFKSWLFMVAKNYCLMQLRDKANVEVELKEGGLPFEQLSEKEELIEKDKYLSLMEEGLKELNYEQKECITLFYLNNKTYQQIAEITGYNLLQVKSYIQNGKRNLKMIIEKKIKKVNG